MRAGTMSRDTAGSTGISMRAKSAFISAAMAGGTWAVTRICRGSNSVMSGRPGSAMSPSDTSTLDTWPANGATNVCSGPPPSAAAGLNADAGDAALHIHGERGLAHGLDHAFGDVCGRARRALDRRGLQGTGMGLRGGERSQGEGDCTQRHHLFRSLPIGYHAGRGDGPLAFMVKLYNYIVT